MFEMRAPGAADPAGSALELLRSAVGVLESESRTTRSSVAVRRRMSSIREAIGRLELLVVRDIQYLDRVWSAETTGSEDLVGFISNDLGVTPEGAKERVTLARQLDALPRTVAQLESGQISFDAAALVARNAAKMRPEQVAEVESGILAQAPYLTPGLLRHHADRVVAAVDAEVIRRDATRASDRRAFKIGPDQDGLARVSGCLTSVAAESLRSALEPHMRPVDRNDRRTPEQRRHDALQVICQKGGGARVVFVVEPTGAAAIGGRVPVTVEEIDRVLPKAVVDVLVKDDRGMPARSVRVFSRAQKERLAAVYRTCAFQGCSRRAEACEGHHLREHARGGMTGLPHGAPLCVFHQRMVHEAGYWLLPGGAGGFITLAPGDPRIPDDRVPPELHRANKSRAIRARQVKRGDSTDAPDSADGRAGP